MHRALRGVRAAKTPARLTRLLSREIVQAINRPDYKERFQQQAPTSSPARRRS
jgi:hypothetical protein